MMIARCVGVKNPQLHQRSAPCRLPHACSYISSGIITSIGSSWSNNFRREWLKRWFYQDIMADIYLHFSICMDEVVWQKCTAYKAKLRPSLKYAAVVCSLPHTTGDINLLKSLQNRAARWACCSRRNFTTNSWTISSQDCCSQLGLPLSKPARRQFPSISFLYVIQVAITIVHPSTLIITFYSIQFYLLEVIICPKLCLTSVIHQLSLVYLLLFLWISLPLHNTYHQ